MNLIQFEVEHVSYSEVKSSNALIPRHHGTKIKRCNNIFLYVTCKSCFPSIWPKITLTGDRNSEAINAGGTVAVSAGFDL